MVIAKKYDNIVYVIEITKNSKEITILSKNSTTTTKHTITNPETQIKRFLRNGYIEIEKPYTYEKLSIEVLDDGADNKGLLRAQKAQPFEVGRAFLPCIGQRKYNGVRCRTKLIFTPELDLFTPAKWEVQLFNKTGIPLSIKHLEKELTILYDSLKQHNIDTEIIFDGEIYKHGLPVGQTYGASVNSKNPNHTSLTFVIFDIINLAMPQNKRLQLLTKIDAIRPPSDYIFITENVSISSLKQIREYRDKFISEGYEGVILRRPDSLYQPKRTYDMLKYKQTYFTKMEVIDVIPNGKYKKQALFVLYDKEYNVTIECSIAATFEQKENILATKHKWIGKQVKVEYRERTPDGKAFHAVATI